MESLPRISNAGIANYRAAISHQRSWVSPIGDSVTISVRVVRIRSSKELAQVSQPVMVRIFGGVVTKRIQVVRQFVGVWYSITIRVGTRWQQVHCHWCQGERFAEGRIIRRDDIDDRRSAVGW